MNRHRPGSNARRRIKARLLKRHGSRCFYCRTPFAAPADATLDHYVPYVMWPGWKTFNLVPCCLDCNQDKGDLLPWPLVWLLLAPAPATPSPAGLGVAA
ncbi:HNH endonuclease [Streptomyces sp. NPDC008150]|uniref:HNH endonuclease n=1 Tax=Streptomyces sp. NPDC008150 TaxID=3364816 RepID=UPI0036F0E228